MMAAWAVEEMKTADLGDERLNKRLTAVLSAFGERPTASIPAACGGRDEMVAAYRFFDNEKVGYEEVLAPHYESTLKRIAAQPLVLLIEDTSELDFTRPHEQVQGAGWLDGSSRRGAYLHPLIGFTPDGTPLGCCWATMWTRDEPPAEERAARRKTAAKPRRLKTKKASGGSTAYNRPTRSHRQVPTTRCVLVADSEADIYRVVPGTASGRGCRLARPYCQDRAILKGERTTRPAISVNPSSLSRLCSRTRSRFVVGPGASRLRDTRTASTPREPHGGGRSAPAATVTLRGPQRPGGSLSPVTVNVVQVREVDPPPDDEPVEWLLVTTLPIATAEQFREVIQYYAVRFMVEVLFRILKSGCRVEERHFEHIDRMLPCVAV